MKIFKGSHYCWQFSSATFLLLLVKLCTILAIILLCILIFSLATFELFGRTFCHLATVTTSWEWGRVWGGGEEPNLHKETLENRVSTIHTVYIKEPKRSSNCVYYTNFKIAFVIPGLAPCSKSCSMSKVVATLRNDTSLGCACFAEKNFCL